MSALFATVRELFLSKSFLIFFMIGVTAAALDYFLYLHLLSYGLPMLLAKVTSSATAVVLNYLLNSQFNFGGGHPVTLKHMTSYGMLYAGLIVVHALFNQGFFLLLQNVQLAVLSALGVSMVVNYLAVKKYFTYYHNH